MPNALKGMPRNNGIKTRKWSVRFSSGRSTTDQIFTLKQTFEKSWEYGKDLFACFVDLEKAYDRVLRDKLWKVLQEYGVIMVNCCALLSHSTADRRFVFG